MAFFQNKIYPRLPLILQNFSISAYGYYWKRRRFGRIFEEELQHFLQREKYTNNEWENYQNEQLRKLLLHAYQTVPLYREKYRNAGLTIEDIKKVTVHELNKFPPLEKDELRKFGTTSLLSTMKEKGGIFLSSSGSTGTPTRIYFSRSFHQRWQAAMEARVRNWAGVTKDSPRGMIGGRRIIPQAYSKPPFYRYNFIEKQVYFSAYHISPQNIQGYISAFDAYPIDYMTGYAFSNYLLADLMEKSGFDAPQLRAVITSSEKLTSAMRETIYKVYKCKVYDSYSGVEACGLISENEYGQLLISPDVGIMEILKPDGTLCKPGETGEVISTGFLNFDQPLIRYKIGDMVKLSADQRTKCGRNMVVVDEIIGRTEDIITGPDGRKMVRFHGLYLGIPGLQAGQLIQNDYDDFTINLQIDRGFNNLYAEGIIRKRLISQLGEVKVRFNYPGQIPLSSNGKFKAVISYLNKSKNAK